MIISKMKMLLMMMMMIYLDEDDCVECDEVLEGLEKIDDETDALDITFVKVSQVLLNYFGTSFCGKRRGQTQKAQKC